MRILAATHCDLRTAAAEGGFRRDLFYRLNVFPLQVPPLRERPEDILLLVTHFIQRHARKTGKQIRSIERRALEWLQDYDWPGNIRELENIVTRAVILCDGDTLSIEKTWLRPDPSKTVSGPFLLSASLLNQEREIIEAALEETRGRISGPLGAAANSVCRARRLSQRSKAWG
ncbi:MAG: sigma 54-interacting transcriptional regulator [Ignavibacteriota bacterium]